MAELLFANPYVSFIGKATLVNFISITAFQASANLGWFPNNSYFNANGNRDLIAERLRNVRRFIVL